MPFLSMPIASCVNFFVPLTLIAIEDVTIQLVHSCFFDVRIKNTKLFYNFGQELKYKSNKYKKK